MSLVRVGQYRLEHSGIVFMEIPRSFRIFDVTLGYRGCRVSALDLLKFTVDGRAIVEAPAAVVRGVQRMRGVSVDRRARIVLCRLNENYGLTAQHCFGLEVHSHGATAKKPYIFSIFAGVA